MAQGQGRAWCPQALAGRASPFATPPSLGSQWRWRCRAWIGAGAGLASVGAWTRGGRGERCQRGYKGGKSSLRGEPGKRTFVRRPQRQGGAGRAGG